MAKTITNWESVETWERLVAGIIASGVKLDLTSVARYNNSTYHTLENRLRKTKKLAHELKVAADGDEGGVTAAAGRGGASASASPTKSAPVTPRKPKTPKKQPLHAVANGRVVKNTPTSSGRKKIKQERHADGEGQGQEDDTPDTPTGRGAGGLLSVPHGWDEEMFNVDLTGLDGFSY